MTNFIVSGSSREIGAIGIVEPFTERISAESSHDAYVSARDKKYAENRELVHITSITADWNDSGEYTYVEPRAYLFSD